MNRIIESIARRTVAHLLIYAKWNAFQVQWVVESFGAVPMDAQNPLALRRDHHLVHVYAADARNRHEELHLHVLLRRKQGMQKIIVVNEMSRRSCRTKFRASEGIVSFQNSSALSRHRFLNGGSDWLYTPLAVSTTDNEYSKRLPPVVWNEEKMAIGNGTDRIETDSI